MTIRAALFDVGGPLDREVLHERLIDLHLREALHREGIKVTQAELDAASERAVWSFAPNTYSAMAWDLAGGDSGRAMRAFAELSARSEQRRIARGGLELRDGVVEMLTTLAATGLLLGLAANQPTVVIAELDRLDLGRLFSHREVSGHHGFRKPDVRLFLRACEDLGVQPGERVMVGDRVDNDIFPARLLGMRTVLLRTGRHLLQRPRSWEEAPDREVFDAPGMTTAVLELVAAG